MIYFKEDIIIMFFPNIVKKISLGTKNEIMDGGQI